MLAGSIEMLEQIHFFHDRPGAALIHVAGSDYYDAGPGSPIESLQQLQYIPDPTTTVSTHSAGS